MDKEKNGFPITSLREIQTLMVANHENIVRVREIVVGDTLTQSVVPLVGLLLAITLKQYDQSESLSSWILSSTI